MKSENDIHSNIASDEEFEVTPGGFNKLTVDLDEDVINRLIKVFVERLHPASIEQFNAELETNTIEVALTSAVINDMIIDSLSAQIKAAEIDNDIDDAI